MSPWVSGALSPVQAPLCSLCLLMPVGTLSFSGGQSPKQDPFSFSGEQLFAAGIEACSQHEEENQFFLMLDFCSLSHIQSKKKNQTGQPTMSLLLVCPLLFLLPPGQLSHSSHQNANLRGREGLLLCHLQALQSIDPPSHVSRCFKVSLRSKLFCTLFSSFKKKKRM